MEPLVCQKKGLILQMNKAFHLQGHIESLMNIVC